MIAKQAELELSLENAKWIATVRLPVCFLPDQLCHNGQGFIILFPFFITKSDIFVPFGNIWKV
jgi:hypothetical protein